MKLSQLFLVSAFFLVSKSFAKTPLIGHDWISVGQLAETQIFQKKEMSLSLFDGIVPEKRQLTAGNFKAEITKSSQLRSSTLELLGTTDWQIKSFNFSENKGSQTVLIRGDFLREKIRFEFTEWQIYSGKKLIQLQLENQKGDPTSGAEVQHLAQWVRDLK